MLMDEILLLNCRVRFSKVISYRGGCMFWTTDLVQKIYVCWVTSVNRVPFEPVDKPELRLARKGGIICPLQKFFLVELRVLSNIDIYLMWLFGVVEHCNLRSTKIARNIGDFEAKNGNLRIVTVDMEKLAKDLNPEMWKNQCHILRNVLIVCPNLINSLIKSWKPIFWTVRMRNYLPWKPSEFISVSEKQCIKLAMCERTWSKDERRNNSRRSAGCSYDIWLLFQRPHHLIRVHSSILLSFTFYFIF